MSNVLMFDQNNRVIRYIKSAHTPDFSGRNDVLINPDVTNINLKAAIVENDTVRNMTQAELDAAIAEDKETNYKRYRAKEYKPWQEQMEMMYFDKINETTTWQDHMASVIEQYPAPDS